MALPLTAGSNPAAAGQVPVLTVAQVVARIFGAIQMAFPSAVWIEGELSNVSYPASGHIYFSLVDEKATDRFGQRLVLPCAFFRNANAHLKFKLEDGMKVLVLGEVTTYQARGQYQLMVMRVEPKGMGALQLAFEQLRKRLEAEGLFAPERKRPIPKLPERVGLVTSGTGSAIHDMVVRLRGKFHVIVLPVKVQGDGAASEIAEAIRLANQRQLAEVLIVGRGGGSIEDLWAFNEEPVARAIAGSAIPVISAVGHQDDWTIADHVADLRASTPTHAAQTLVESRQLLLDAAAQAIQQLQDGMQAYLDEQDAAVASLSEQLRLLHPANQMQQLFDRTLHLQAKMVSSTRYALDAQDRHLQGLAGRLQALSPLAVLARGYSITTKLPDRRVVTSPSQLRTGDELETLLAGGRAVSTVTRLETTKPQADDDGADE